METQTQTQTSKNFNEYSFYYNYKGLIKAIILNNYKSKEEKEKVLNNLLGYRIPTGTGIAYLPLLTIG